MQSPRHIPSGVLAQCLVAVGIRADNAWVNIVELLKRSEAATCNPVEPVEAESVRTAGVNDCRVYFVFGTVGDFIYFCVWRVCSGGA